MVFCLNFCSVFPYVFARTAQLGGILFVSLSLWLSANLFKIINSTEYFLSHMIPEGTPLPLVPFLFLIEIIRNLIRPVTLTVRLVANILAGHLLIILTSGLVFSFFLAFPLLLILNAVELAVALIQAYIFTTILALYFFE